MSATTKPTADQTYAALLNMNIPETVATRVASICYEIEILNGRNQRALADLKWFTDEMTDAMQRNVSDLGDYARSIAARSAILSEINDKIAREDAKLRPIIQTVSEMTGIFPGRILAAVYGD